MFCYKCGKPTRPGADFCQSCGAPVRREDAEPVRHGKTAIVMAVALLLAASVALLAVFVIVPWVRGPGIDVDAVSDVLDSVGPEILEVNVEGDDLEVVFEQPDLDTYDLSIIYLAMFDLAQYAAPEGKSVTLINACDGVPLIRTTASNKDTIAWRDGEVSTQEYIGSWRMEPSEQLQD